MQGEQPSGILELKTPEKIVAFSKALGFREFFGEERQDFFHLGQDICSNILFIVELLFVFDLRHLFVGCSIGIVFILPVTLLSIDRKTALNSVS